MVRKMKPLLLVGMIVFGVVLGGCSLVAKPADISKVSPTTSVTGTVVVAGDMITVSDGVVQTEVISRKLDLKQYAGKVVTVTGEFSGTTLYVDELR